MYTALLVDDEISVLDDLEKNINWKSVGIRHIFRADSVRSAYEKFRLYRPDIVISDMEMVGGSGLELLERLKSEEKDLRFLFLTCHPEFEYMRKAMRLGSCDYLLKPIDYHELETVLIRLLSDPEAQKAGAAPLPPQFPDTRGEEELTLSAKQYIQDHLIEKLKVIDIAQALNYSESHLMRAFKSQAGQSIVEYITQERIHMAGELLKNTDWNIAMVSAMCGYDDGAYFARVFKKITSLSPKEYQKKYRGE